MTCLLLAIASVPVLSTRRSGGESDHLLEHLELDSPVRQQVLHRHPVGVSGGLLEAASDLAAKFRACVRRGVACRADQLSHQREDLAADYERLQVHATATSDAVRCAREVERGRAVKEAASNIPLDVLFQTGNVKSGVDAGHFGGRGVDDDDLAAAREDRGS